MNEALLSSGWINVSGLIHSSFVFLDEENGFDWLKVILSRFLGNPVYGSIQIDVEYNALNFVAGERKN